MKIGSNNNQRIGVLEQSMLRVQNQNDQLLAMLQSVDKTVFEAFKRIQEDILKQETVLRLVAKSAPLDPKAVSAEERAAVEEFVGDTGLGPAIQPGE